MESSTEPDKWLYECDDLQQQFLRRQGTCRKCSHKNPKICYGDISDSEKNQYKEDTTDTSTVRSEEQLIETINFESEDSDPAIEKCLKFWKSILDTNLKPTKFHLKANQLSRKRTTTGTVIVDSNDDTHKPSKWRDLLEDIKRLNFDKVKLVKKIECKSINPDDLDCGLQSLLKKNRSKKPHYKSSEAARRAMIERNKVRMKAAREKRELAELQKSQLFEQNVSKRTLMREMTQQSMMRFDQEKLEKERRERGKLRRQLAAQSKQLSSSSSNKSTYKDGAEDPEAICCVCGCGVDYCLCETCNDALTPETLEELKMLSLKLVKEISEGEEPLLCDCGCLVQCSCEDLTNLEKFDCACGCDIKDCICNLYGEDERKNETTGECPEDPWDLKGITANSYCIICGGYCSCEK